MKLVILAALLALPLSASAIMAKPKPVATGDARIYKALDVKEVNVTPHGMAGSVKFRKSVGGLVCDKSRVVYPNAPEKFDCRLSITNRDDGAIYEALNVEEEYTTPDGVLGVSTYEKSVGGLTCTKTTVVYPNAVPDYNCSVK